MNSLPQATALAGGETLLPLAEALDLAFAPQNHPLTPKKAPIDNLSSCIDERKSFLFLATNDT